MGSIWLTDLADWCREDGIAFREYPGWKTRARSSGGFDQVWGVVAHHTASSGTWQSDAAYEWVNAVNKPIGNVNLGRDGVVTIGAAGATNTNGRGIAPWSTSKGVIPIEPTTMGNRMAFAIEAANNGVGEVWNRQQMDAYLRFMNMLCRRLGLDPMRDVTTHRGWAGTRKSDPFGPAEGYPTLGTGTWPVLALRTLVRDAAPTPPPPPPPPTPPPPVFEEIETMLWLIGKTTEGAWFAASAPRAGALHVPTKVQNNYPFAAGGGAAFDVGQGTVVRSWNECKPIPKAELLQYLGSEV